MIVDISKAREGQPPYLKSFKTALANKNTVMCAALFSTMQGGGCYNRFAIFLYLKGALTVERLFSAI